jgi:hypothetical protein
MIEHLTKVKNILMIPKANLIDKKTNYYGSKGHSAVSDVHLLTLNGKQAIRVSRCRFGAKLCH